MNEKEVAEIRRRFRPDKNNITHIIGCYVNEKREIISRFDQALSFTPAEETENLLSVLKRTLSGTLGKNLLDITFQTQQVVDSDEHRLLMALKNTALKDEEVVDTFFQKAIEAVSLEGNFLVLLAYDTYDVPYHSKDGAVQADASSEVFSYVLCSICPVKMTKPVLSYHVPDNCFHNSGVDWVVAPPELGFMFPAFDDRSANIYNALHYSKDAKVSHEAFINAIFCCEVPVPAEVQKETFESILSESLGEECRFDVVQAVHEQFCEMVEEHKASKDPEPLAVSKGTVKRVLSACGALDEQVAVFEEKYDALFGVEAQVNPRNLVDSKQFEVRTPDVMIRVSPQCSDLLETRVIDGKKYILVRADEGVEVNGVPIRSF